MFHHSTLENSILITVFLLIFVLLNFSLCIITEYKGKTRNLDMQTGTPRRPKVWANFQKHCVGQFLFSCENNLSPEILPYNHEI